MRPVKILTAEQMKRIDRLTVERAGVSFRQLMENAGRQVAEFLFREFSPLGSVTILCGKGNNGGDALVAARHLHQRGHPARVVLLAAANELKGDARASYQAWLEAGGGVETVQDVEEWKRKRETVLDCDILVDGLLGTGLTGPARSPLNHVIQDVNAQHGRFRVLAVDIPSGLPSDGGEAGGETIEADATVTFTAPKHGHIFPPHCARVGRLAVAPIGSPEALYTGDPELFLELIVRRTFSHLPLQREPWAHKGRYGHVLLVAGARGKTGAAALAGKAALRMGAGLVTVGTPEGSLPIVAALVPEIMTEPLAQTESGSVSTRALDYGGFAKLAEDKTVLALGPGLTTHPETRQFVAAVLQQSALPLVLDADALNALVGQLETLGRRRAERVVLTPHPGEMARLLGTTSAEVQSQRVEVARRFAREYGVYVILKGYRTLVAAP
ncbi:MAG: NAD(P)H-hydrate dehydratase, partial [Terriglobia bacterium]